MKKLISLYTIWVAIIGVFTPMVVTAQTKDYGRFNGSLESSVGFYFKDKKLSSGERQEDFGTNTFLNLGYEIGNFRIGLEYDLFEPPMIGFSHSLKGNKLMQGFVSYSNSNLEVCVGTFFEQFGSGLLFRAYEDRSLAINTSLMGCNVRFSPVSWLTIKGMVGVPKKFLEYAKTTVYGTDLEFFLHEALFRNSDATLVVGGSWILREDRNDIQDKIAPQVVHGYSGRLQLTKGGISFGGEYVTKSKQQMLHPLYGTIARRGEALLLNGGVDYAGFGFSASYRALRYMEFSMDDIFSTEFLTLNYLPSLTQQHKYSLMSLYPHKVEGAGEMGGQFDLFGEIPCGDNSPILFSLNGSMFHSLKEKDSKGEYYLLKKGDDLLFAEVGGELKRKWSRNLNTTLAVAWQQKDEFSRLGHGDMLMNTEIVVADILYKFNSKKSLRVELSHAWSDSKDDQAWGYGLVELGIAPRWMFYVSDMCNYKTDADPIHYYSMGGSFSWEKMRFAVAYGRNRAGYLCSGGVCHYVPEHNGLTMNLSVIF